MTGAPASGRRSRARSRGATVARGILVACLCALSLGFRWGDRNHDGILVIGCLGDSNTFTWWSRGKVTSWCDRIAAAEPGWTVRNYAVPKAMVTRSKQDQLQHALDEDPKADVVVLAFGTNDIAFYDTPTIVDALRALRRRAHRHGVETLIALTPPAMCVRPAARIDALNAALREAFPADMLVDFHSGFVLETGPGGDFYNCLHLNDAGQRKRAQRVLGKLRGGGPQG